MIQEYIIATHDDGPVSVENYTWQPPTPVERTEGAILIMVAVIGGLGNLVTIAAIFVIRSFRKSSSAFLCHHCLLDIIKSLMCIPFGYSLLMNTHVKYCNTLGASYIFLMTLTAYNLLAILINEEYQLQEGKRQSRGDYCCIIFGLFMIWFTTILLHLGVVFIPGTTEYNNDIGSCVFLYGKPSNYVIHVLWVLLVSGALMVSVISFVQFYRKLHSQSKCHRWTLIHQTVSMEMNATDSSDDEYHIEFDDIAKKKALKNLKIYMRRVVMMVMMVGSYTLFWYPLFLLTLFDIHYSQPAYVYRYLTIFAWTHPLTTPVFCGMILYDLFQRQTLTREVYSNSLPLKTSRSKEALRHKLHQKYKAYDTGFMNENFESTPSHQPLRGGTTNDDPDGSDNERFASSEQPLTLNYEGSTLIL
ncbi:uncharacterized protein [Haliotis cracherodii]|uniref:uncharacterized protein LOC125373488 n=1 Tax=Haliotis rufescens TaxID=6454 RepID=UPI00201F222A|nr:uncharacterized protein LOC125373488 [Haliotis rufescens]